MRKYLLSTVVTSRNDNHGGNLLKRMQCCMDSFIFQCERHEINAEFIIVEWNPPKENNNLYEVLKFSKSKFCDVRIITVPADIHHRLPHSNHLQMFQMIAKNVGIRRALGDYILATNVDILFSDKLFSRIKTDLRPGKLYRVDRVDVSSNNHKQISPLNVIQYCEKHKIRINKKSGTYINKAGKWVKHKQKQKRKYIYFTIKIPIRLSWKEVIKLIIEKILVALGRILILTVRKLLKRIKIYIRLNLHTNGCGDFTLLARNDWFQLRGYPEWSIFSWHLDSVLLYQAKKNGIKEKYWKNCDIYHIEHSIGSGYTPEGTTMLFKHLDDNKIPYLTWNEFLNIIDQIHQAKNSQHVFTYNDSFWGLSEEKFGTKWAYPRN